MLRTKCILVQLVVLFCLSSPVLAFEMTPYQMVEDLMTDSYAPHSLQYYYYIPCPSNSWFWGVTGWRATAEGPADIIGSHFRLDDQSTGRVNPCCRSCQEMGGISVLDFAGYGVVYPGLFTVEVRVCCADENGYPQGPSVWYSSPMETGYGWNYIDIEPDIPFYCELTSTGYLSLVVTMAFIGYVGTYPSIGFDNIRTPLESACEMRDVGGLPAEYPRNCAGGPEPRVHSGYVGTSYFEHWPPIGFADGGDTSDVVSEFGFAEVAWRGHFYSVAPGG